MMKKYGFPANLFLAVFLLITLGCQMPFDEQKNNSSDSTGAGNNWSTGNDYALPIAQVVNNSAGPINQVQIGGTMFSQNLMGNTGNATGFIDVPEGMNNITVYPNGASPVMLNSLGSFSKGKMYAVNIRGTVNNYSAELWQRSNTNTAFNDDGTKIFISSVSGGMTGGTTGGTAGGVNAMQIAQEFTISVPLGYGPKCLASDGTSIYLYKADYSGSSKGEILNIDPATGIINTIYSIKLANNTANGIYSISGMIWYNGSLWGIGGFKGPMNPPDFAQGVFKINLATGLSENQIPAGNGIDLGGAGLGGFACDGTNFVVSMDLAGGYQDLGIVKFSPGSTTIPTYPFFYTASLPRDITYGGGYFWYKDGGTFQKADASTMRVIKDYTGAPGQGILYLNDKLWGIDNNKLIAYTLQ